MTPTISANKYLYPILADDFTFYNYIQSIVAYAPARAKPYNPQNGASAKYSSKLRSILFDKRTICQGTIFWPGKNDDRDLWARPKFGILVAASVVNLVAKIITSRVAPIRKYISHTHSINQMAEYLTNSDVLYIEDHIVGIFCSGTRRAREKRRVSRWGLLHYSGGQRQKCEGGGGLSLLVGRLFPPRRTGISKGTEKSVTFKWFSVKNCVYDISKWAKKKKNAYDINQKMTKYRLNPAASSIDIEVTKYYFG